MRSRRSFFRLLGAAAPAIFVPKLIAVRWKVVPVRQQISWAEVHPMFLMDPRDFAGKWMFVTDSTSGRFQGVTEIKLKPLELIDGVLADYQR